MASHDETVRAAISLLNKLEKDGWVHRFSASEDGPACVIVDMGDGLINVPASTSQESLALDVYYWEEARGRKAVAMAAQMMDWID